MEIFITNAISLNRKSSIIFIVVHFHFSFFIPFIYLPYSMSCFNILYFNWQYLKLFLWILYIILSFVYILIWKLTKNWRWLNSMARLITANSSTILHMIVVVKIMKMAMLSSFFLFLFFSTTILSIYIALSLIQKKPLWI